MTDNRQMRPASDVRMLEGSANAGGTRHNIRDTNAYYYDPAPLSEYPRMLYKRTEHEQTQDWADAVAELKDKPMVVNKFDGLLCETCIANSLTEAEALAELGWETSPQAAYGMATGIGAAVSAKDGEIERLRAELAAAKSGSEAQVEKRGPGRPKLSPAI